MASQMADWVQSNTTVGKAYGSRAELVKSLATFGEFAAAVQRQQRRVIKGNDKLLRRAKQQDAYSKRALEMFQRAQDADTRALGKLTSWADGKSTTEAFEPAEWEITRRAESVVQREMKRINGHGGNNNSEAGGM
jgi:hypothetical protein